MELLDAVRAAEEKADGIRRDAEAYAAKCSNLQASARRREATSSHRRRSACSSRS